MLFSQEPSVLGNSNQGYSLPYNALCRLLLPLLEWQLASSVLVVYFALKCLTAHCAVFVWTCLRQQQHTVYQGIIYALFFLQLLVSSS